MSTSVSVRLPDHLDQALRKLSKVTDRSKTYLIAKAIEVFIREYADYRIALDRFHDKDDGIITSSEMRKRLAF